MTHKRLKHYENRAGRRAHRRKLQRLGLSLRTICSLGAATGGPVSLKEASGYLDARSRIVDSVVAAAVEFGRSDGAERGV